MKTPKLLLSILGLIAALVPALPAASVVDSFNDVSTNANVGMTTWAGVNGASLRSDTGPTAGGIGFLGGFSQTSGVLVYATNDLTVALDNYVSGQTNTVRHWSVGGVTTSSGFARRTQARITPTFNAASDKVIWFSFVVSLNTTNAEAALCFNPYLKGTGVTGNNINGTPSGYSDSGGGPGPAAPGLRIGLGGASAGVQGALGIGPVEGPSYDCGLTNITGNGLDGAITAAKFAPLNGTAGLVLGCIYTTNGYQAVNVWYNPDVTSQASLPAPTLTFVDTSSQFVPASISSVGYQLCRDDILGVRDAYIDNVKVSDETNGFNIVYANATPTEFVQSITVGVVVSNAIGYAYPPSPSNLVFNVQCNQPIVGSPLALNYTLGGTAVKDVIYSDPNAGVVTIPVGKTNALVNLVPLAMTNAEGTLTVTFTLQPQAGVSLATNYVATGKILATNTAGVSVQYMFAQSMSPQIWDTNMLAAAGTAPVLGNLAFTARYAQYTAQQPYSFIASEALLTNTEAGAVANNDYLSVTLAPTVGRTMTLTNISFQAVYGNWLFQNPNATFAGIVVRSSLDNFTSDVGSVTMSSDDQTFPTVFQNFNINLGNACNNQSGNVEFRFYFYSATPSASPLVGIFMNNLYFNGSTTANPGVPQVTVVASVPTATEPASSGQFTITRTNGSTAGALNVFYTMTGTAANGVDYVSLSGTATIAAGQGSVVIPVTPQGVYHTNSPLTATLTLLNGAGYGLRSPASDTVSINNGNLLPAGILLTYGFNENNNSASFLSSVAKATVNAYYTNAVTAANASAGAGLGNFGAAAPIGHAYSSYTTVSSPGSFYVNDTDFVAPWIASETSESLSVSSNTYVSFVVQPNAGYQMSVTNFSAWVLSLTGVALTNAPGTNVYFLRSSADNFANDLGAYTNAVLDNSYTHAWTLWNVPMNFTNYPGPIEFRVYFYVLNVWPSQNLQRMDDVTFYGSAGSNPAGNQVVTVKATVPQATESGSVPGAFTLSRYGDASGSLAFTYAMSGTAINGGAYAALSGTTNFGPNITTIVLPVNGLNVNLGTPTQTATLTATSHPGLPAFDSVTITNDVAVTVNLNPTNLTAIVSGGVLVLQWPADHTGWYVQAQSNSLTGGLGTNWVTIPNSNLGNSLTNPVNLSAGAVFYRMFHE